ncbi:MAG: STAS domain-containing protein [Mycobacterium sp.]
MVTPLSLDTARREDGSMVLIAAGEIDLSNVGAFTEALGRAIAAGSPETLVVVDLGAVDYLDSGAISVLFERVDNLRVVANPVLIPVLTISGLTQMTSVEPSPNTP